MISLRHYQLNLIDQLRELMKKGIRRLCLQSPTGSGKTVLIAFMIWNAVERGKRVLFVVHRRELIEQSLETFRKFGLKPGVISAGYTPSDSLVQIASVQTLSRRKPPYADLCIWDECFPAGTLVGGKPIESLRLGDKVNTHLGYRRVVRTFKSRPNCMVRVTLNDGQSLCATFGHPFFTQRGWVDAGLLIGGNDELFHVREEGVFFEQEVRVGMQKEGASILQQDLLNEISISNIEHNHGENKSQIRFEADEKKQPNAQRRNKEEGVINITCHEMETAGARGEWKGNKHSAKNAGTNAWLENRSGCANKKCEDQEMLYTLQNRHRKPRPNDCDRGGRSITLRTGAQTTRQKERKNSCWIRVESIEILEQGSDARFGGVCPDGFVYNIEVEEAHTYFANGYLVHNCHHVAANTWKKLFACYTSAFHIGLTATPCRLDGKGLKDFFDHLVIGPTIPWLIENNYLSKFQMFAPPGISIDSVKVRMGDFDKEDLTEQASKPEVMGSAITEYKNHCEGQQAIIFSPSIIHSKRIENEFNLHGIKACHLDGKTDDTTRADIVKAFRAKQIKVLTNVDLFGEGFDVPGIHCVIDLSPTLSLGKYLQRVGRGLRPDIGKDIATFLDHAGNVYRHGLPDQERQWTLEGVEKTKRNASSDGVRICSSCFAAQAPALVCRFCGFTFEIKPREILETEGSLTKIEKIFIQQKKKSEQSSAWDYNSLVSLGMRRGYKNPRGWAKHVMESREKKRARA